jgi:hypothetical protein
LSSLEQPFTDLVLQLQDLLTQRGLCYSAFSGGPAEITCPSDGRKIAELMHLHRLLLS